MNKILSQSIDTKLIYELLIEIQVGQFVSYDEISALLGRPIRDAIHLLTSARTSAMRDKQIVFGVVKGKGLSRLSDEEVVHTGDQSIKKIRNEARRGGRRITSLQDFNALPNSMKVKHNMYASALGTIAQFTKPSEIKKIEAAVETAQEKISFNKTLRLFGGG